jgi:nucleotide sugar dehydrogenase
MAFGISDSMEMQSIAPDGRIRRIPSVEEARSAFENVARAAAEHRSRGGRIVVVQGLGFVGSAVAVAIASATDAAGRPLHFVIGVDLPTPQAHWKIDKINSGLPPIASTDTELARLMRVAVHDQGNLRATSCEDAYSLADVIVVDVHLDAEGVAEDPRFGIKVDVEPFRSAMQTIGCRMQPNALVLIETTVPIGTCDRIVLPTLREERLARGIKEPVLLAHAYERVMPGPEYVSSIRALPRVFAGVDEASSAAAREFLATFVDVAEGDGLRRLDEPRSSELAKLLENSYRATNIAFIHEWTLLAEELGIDLFATIDAIRVRKGTHDNMRYPGFGVGGYCLPKDSLLAQWGATHLLGSDVVLGMTLEALRTNSLMPLHTARLVKEAASGNLSGRVIAVCGVSYLPDVADTRNSPTEILADDLSAAGAHVRAHDPTLEVWVERPNVPIIPQIRDALRDVDGVVLGVPHLEYRNLTAGDLTRHVGRSAFLVDAQNIVSDETAVELHAAGWQVLGVGKGHWRKRGLHLPE